MKELSYYIWEFYSFNLDINEMKERQFKVGDRIKLNPSSKYYHQAKDEMGTILSMDYTNGDDGIGYHSSWIRVEFDNDYKNSYLPEDLCYPIDHAKLSSNKECAFKVGDKIQITQASNHWVDDMDQYVGREATITKVEEGYVVDRIYRIDIDKGDWKWIAEAGHFIHAPQKGIDQKDELLHRAKEMFPVGTKFCPAHQADEYEIKEKTHCIITDDTSIEFDENGDIIAMVGSHRWFNSEAKEYGNTPYDRIVYYARDKKWAHVYPVKEEPLHKFSIGDWVIGNSKANERYAVTREGWSGQVTEIREEDGYITVKGKYNEDNDKYHDLDPDRFDLTTESKLMELIGHVEEPIVHKYKVGDILHLIESCHAVTPQKVTVSALSTRHGKPAYRLERWSGDFPEDILLMKLEEVVKDKHSFKVGDYVKAKDSTPYTTTTKGWLGEVSRVWDDGDIEVRGHDGQPYNVNAKYFDHYNVSYIQWCFDKASAKLDFLKPRVEVKSELPISKVKKVSFNRI